MIGFLTHHYINNFNIFDSFQYAMAVFRKYDY